MVSDEEVSPATYRKREGLSIEEHVTEVARELGASAASRWIGDDDARAILRAVGRRDLSAEQWLRARGAFAAGFDG